MPYKPTGNPPGRPRKTVEMVTAIIDEPAPQIADDTPQPLSRAREGFRRAFADPAAGLHRPPRLGHRRQHVGKRPILHPNVIVKA